MNLADYTSNKLSVAVNIPYGALCQLSNEQLLAVMVGLAHVMAEAVKLEAALGPATPKEPT